MESYESYRPARSNGAISFLGALENIAHSFILGQVLYQVLEIGEDPHWLPAFEELTVY